MGGQSYTLTKTDKHAVAVFDDMKTTPAIVSNGDAHSGFRDEHGIIPEVCGALSDGAHMGGGLTGRTPTPDELSRTLNAGGMGRCDWETETQIVTPVGGFFSDEPEMAVRRLTPLECERLQGFPDNFTLIEYKGKPSKDGPRCKAIGNSMAVPVMAWIGKRIQEAHERSQ